MRFYEIEKIGDGTRENPFCPNIPEDVFYVSTEMNLNFLVGTNTVLDHHEIPDIELFCETNGISYEDISNWFVGD